MIHQKTPMRRLNMMNAHGFVRTVGEAFEHSPWVAERAFHFHPFSTIDDLHQKMCKVVKEASEQDRVALIRAHPDLVGRMAQPLTPQSQAEQATAGLDRLAKRAQPAVSQGPAARVPASASGPVPPYPLAPGCPWVQRQVV